MKTEITANQKRQFNLMLSTLKMISKGYASPEKLRKDCEKEYGLEYHETLEISYENILNDARYGCKGIKELK